MKSTAVLAALALLALSAPAFAQSSDSVNGSAMGTNRVSRDGMRREAAPMEGRAGAAEAPPGDKADLTPSTNYNDILKNGN